MKARNVIRMYLITYILRRRRGRDNRKNNEDIPAKTSGASPHLLNHEL